MSGSMPEPIVTVPLVEFNRLVGIERRIREALRLHAFTLTHHHRNGEALTPLLTPGERELLASVLEEAP
jgi:hypothetical protein